MKGTSISALAGVALSAIFCILPPGASAVEILTDDELQDVVARGEQVADLQPGDLQAAAAALPGDGVLAPGQISSMIASGKVSADFPVKVALALFLPPEVFDYSVDIGAITDEGDHTAKAQADGSFEASLYARIAYFRLLRLRTKGAPESRSFGDIEFNNIQFGADSTIRVSFL